MADKIKWCMAQKNGIELVKPNNNLSKAYLIKAENALKAMRETKDNIEWEISSCYYSMYFSLYSILMRLGIKCEIHSCTIEFMNVYLNNFFEKEYCKLIGDSMGVRIDVQYYTDRTVDKKLHAKMILAAPDFLVKCKQVLLELRESDVKKIRGDLEKVKKVR